MVIDVLVIKVASRCNLNCTYCYVYNVGDKTYLNQPKLMSYDTVDWLIKRVLEHCMKNGLKKFMFIFHGGEPMLHKKEFYTYYVEQANKILYQKNGIRCSYGIQTNGVLISKEWINLFNNLDINVGISLDGVKEVNDKYRVDHKGKGSYDNTIKGFGIAKEKLKTSLSLGLLSVIDIEANPLETYDHMKNLGTRAFDLKWPYATYDLPANTSLLSKTAYADWLIKIFDVWFKEEVEVRPRVSIFETIISLVLGVENIGNEDFGSNDNQVLCVQTNGDLEAVGALNLCGNGFTKSGSNIREHSISDAIQTDLAKLYHQSHKKLNKKCLKCPIVDVCGGGHIVSRFSKKNGFDNVSVYCQDYMKLFTHIQNSLFDRLPEELKGNYEKIIYEELNLYFDQLEFDTVKNSEHYTELNSFK
ncbi:radical SAM protein [Aquimarina algiphila]|uniref:radical SAM protein n=1 Tax=Aquimarina algiphila TaxID=2047982 RepID=UPI002490128C|nr:radical SAM protein [Aquimarina algiphila]